jgi:hypothetical protein
VYDGRWMEVQIARMHHKCFQTEFVFAYESQWCGFLGGQV